MSHIVRKPDFSLCENKGADQLRSNCTAKLISAFVFATQMVQCLYFLNPNFPTLVIFCACTARFGSDLVGNPEDVFSRSGSHIVYVSYMDFIFPATDSLVSHDLGKRCCQTLSEEPLTWLTPRV